MRTHAKIVQEATVAKVREVLADRDIHLTDPTVRSWVTRPDTNGSIPSRYWNALSEAGIASLEELAIHAAAKAKSA